jgi:hypothetical protein
MSIVLVSKHSEFSVEDYLILHGYSGNEVGLFTNQIARFTVLIIQTFSV